MICSTVSHGDRFIVEPHTVTGADQAMCMCVLIELSLSERPRTVLLLLVGTSFLDDSPERRDPEVPDDLGLGAEVPGPALKTEIDHALDCELQSASNKHGHFRLAQQTACFGYVVIELRNAREMVQK